MHNFVKMIMGYIIVYILESHKYHDWKDFGGEIGFQLAGTDKLIHYEIKKWKA